MVFLRESARCALADSRKSGSRLLSARFLWRGASARSLMELRVGELYCVTRRPSEKRRLHVASHAFLTCSISHLCGNSVFFVCHDVCVSMRSRVLSCMCVSVLSECAFLDVMPMCSSDTQATPALRRLSLHLSQLVCEQSSHAEAPPVGKQRKAG